MKPKKTKSYNILFYTNVLLVMLTILSGLASFVDPRTIWIFSFLGLVFPFLVIVNLLYILFWLFKKLRYSFISIACLFLFQNQISNSFAFNLPTSKIEQVNSFTIMSYNTSNFRNLVTQKKQIIDKRNHATKFIATDIKPDILCTQELAGTPVKELMRKFKKYNIHELEPKGTMIFSKFPIINKGEIDFKTKTNSCLWADIKVFKDTIRIYSVHLQSNNISKDATNLLTENDKQKDWNKITTILKNYKKYSIRRAKQADMVRKHINKSPHPILLCGDLNDTPQSYTYKTLKGKLQDAFIQKGSLGLGVSFGGSIPGLRIDYIFPDKRINVLSYKKYKKDYSDHFPIISTLKIN